jgi:predicted enzyme related to lactoylglutathione lyase
MSFVPGPGLIGQGMSRNSAKPIVHLELHTHDVRRARDFYTRLCGWQAERVVAASKSYLALDLANGFGGGIVECDVPEALWLPYVEVDEITEATERARMLGAEVTLEPREGPAGWRSSVAAPGSGEIAFWQPKR